MEVCEGERWGQAGGLIPIKEAMSFLYFLKDINNG